MIQDSTEYNRIARMRDALRDSVYSAILAFLSMVVFASACESASETMISPDASVGQRIFYDYERDPSEFANELVRIVDLIKGDYSKICDLPVGAYRVTFCDRGSVIFVLSDGAAARLAGC